MNDPRNNAVMVNACGFAECGLPVDHDGPHKVALELRAAMLRQVFGDGVKTPATVSDVPNKPKTPISNFRIPEDVKVPAMERAAAEGKTLTDVVVEHLRRYGRGGRRGADA